MAEISIKIGNDIKIARYIQIVRKYSSKSLNDVKNSINGGKPVLSSDYFNTDGITNLLSAYQELREAGAELTIFEDERAVDVEVIYNLINMHDEIDRERQEVDDRMFE